MSKKLIYLFSVALVPGLFCGVASADPFQQDPGPDGIVSMEAENFDENVPNPPHTWIFVTEPEGFSGTGAMQSTPTDPGGGAGPDTGYVENSPRLDFEVNFTKTGIHYIWIRGYGQDGNSDSCHAGINGEGVESAHRFWSFTTSYTWLNVTNYDPPRRTIDVPSAGVHTVNVWMREDACIVDKIVLTTNPDYTPTGEGPEESHRGPRLKAYHPAPDDGELYEDTWASLSWSAGETAVSHDVYFGDNFDDVNDGTGDTFQDNQAGIFYIVGFPGYPYPDGLIPGTTYYWRIDEVEADGTTKHKGYVWSFTIPPKTAYNPEPADGAKFIDPDVELSWTAGFGVKLHTVYFGDNFADVNDGVVGLPQATTTFTPGTLELDKVYYWRVDEFDGLATNKGHVWSFKTLPLIDITDPNLVGWWKLDEGSDTTALDWSGHSNHGTLEGDPQWAAGQIGGALEFDGTGDYVNCGNLPALTITQDITVTCWIKVAAFSKTWETIIAKGDNSYRMSRGPGDGDSIHFGCNGPSGGNLNATTIVTDDTWHHVALVYDGSNKIIYIDGAEDARVASTGSIDVSSYNLFIGENSQATSRHLTGLVDDVRVYNKALTLEEIKEVMRGEPDLAWDPKPSNGSIPNIDDAMPLSWSSGDFAAQHDVYFGTDKDAVADADASDTTGIYRGRQAATSYTPAEGVEWGGGPYYWRIDEYNTDETISTGRIWSFTVADFILVDDFEDYDAGDNQIWYAWKDGLGYGTPGTDPYYAGNGSGSAVGDETTGSYTEETIVHGGRQSMPLFYDNNQQGKFKYSEAELTLTYPRDWTKHGIGVLSLWFRGNPAGFVEGPAGTYTMSASGVDIWGTADEFRYAWKQLSGAGTISAQVLSVQNTDPWAKAGVMIRESLDPGSKFAFVCVTPGNGLRFQARLSTGSSATSDTSVVTPEQTAITAPYWVKLERDAAGNFNGYYSSDGVSWQAMSWNPQRISMPTNVYIGLALTSHSSGVTCVAGFSNVQTTGTVTPMIWTHEAIGAAMASNDAEPMYVALNGSAVVFHDNPNAALIDTWTEWNIDLQGFADQGVNLANVNTIAIGFGDKKNPQAGGSGTAYFDDIRLYRPAP